MEMGIVIVCLEDREYGSISDAGKDRTRKSASLEGSPVALI